MAAPGWARTFAATCALLAASIDVMETGTSPPQRRTMRVRKSTSPTRARSSSPRMMGLE
jgi:hypothetical protein